VSRFDAGPASRTESCLGLPVPPHIGRVAMTVECFAPERNAEDLRETPGARV